MIHNFSFRNAKEPQKHAPLPHIPVPEPPQEMEENIHLPPELLAIISSLRIVFITIPIDADEIEDDEDL
jgi:hypothetical protein